jgi:hypothetical protein
VRVLVHDDLLALDEELVRKGHGSDGIARSGRECYAAF